MNTHSPTIYNTTDNLAVPGIIPGDFVVDTDTVLVCRPDMRLWFVTSDLEQWILYEMPRNARWHGKEFHPVTFANDSRMMAATNEPPLWAVGDAYFTRTNGDNGEEW